MQSCADIANQPSGPGSRLADSEIARIGPVRTTHQGHRVEAEFQIGTQRHQIYFQSDDIALADNLETCLTAALVPALTKGGSLAVPGPVSQRLLAATPTIVDIFTSWYPMLRRVGIQDAVPVARDVALGQRVGAFFSGGVDSFYTFLKHREEVTDLIFVHGFDIRLDDAPLRRMTSEMVRRVASEFGKGVVEVETNLRSLLDPYADWRDLTHGAALATVGHLLSGFFGRIYIAAAYSYAGLLPNGTHPLLDPLWSTEALDFVHDGCEASRLDKVAFISRHEVALENLRVCWKNPDGAYNCGRCEKCHRVVGMLKAIDVDPSRLGYTEGQVTRCLAGLPEKSLHQESASSQHTLYMLAKKGLIEPNESYAQNNEIEHLRFDSENSPQKVMPKKIRDRVLKIQMEHASGALLKKREKWVKFDPFL